MKHIPIGVILLTGILSTMAYAFPRFETTHRIQASADFMALNHDGTLLATSGSAGRPILLWDTASGAQIAQLDVREQLGFDTNQTYKSEQIVFSPNNELMATAHRDNVIRVWRLKENGQPARRIDRPIGEIELPRGLARDGVQMTAMAFSRDARSLFVGASIGLIIDWDIRRGRVSQQSQLSLHNLIGSGAIMSMHTPGSAGVLLTQAHSAQGNVVVALPRLLNASLEPVWTAEPRQNVLRLTVDSKGQKALLNTEIWDEELRYFKRDVVTLDIATGSILSMFGTNAEPESSLFWFADDVWGGLYRSWGMMDIFGAHDGNKAESFYANTSPVLVISTDNKVAAARFDNGSIHIQRILDMHPAADWIVAIREADYALEAFEAGFGNAAVQQMRAAIARDSSTLGVKGYSTIIARAGMPASLIGEMLSRNHLASLAETADGQWSDARIVWNAGLDYIVHAVHAGQYALARSTLDYLRTLDARAVAADKLENFPWLFAYLTGVESLILAAQGDIDDAYGRLLQEREFSEHMSIVFSDQNEFSQAPFWAPMFTDTRRLAFVSGVEESVLQEVMQALSIDPAHRPSQQPYPALDGTLLRPPTAPPALEL